MFGNSLYDMGHQDGIRQRTLADATQAFVERLQGRQDVVIDVGPLLAENNALRYEVARLSQELANSRAEFKDLQEWGRGAYKELRERCQELTNSRAECQRVERWAESTYQKLLELRAARAKR